MPTEEEIRIYAIVAVTFLALVGLIVQIYFRQGKIINLGVHAEAG